MSRARPINIAGYLMYVTYCNRLAPHLKFKPKRFIVLEHCQFAGFQKRLFSIEPKLRMVTII